MTGSSAFGIQTRPTSTAADTGSAGHRALGLVRAHMPPDDLHDVRVRVASRTGYQIGVAARLSRCSGLAGASLQWFRVCLKVYLMGAVRGPSLVSRTKMASSFAGSVLLA